MWLHSVRHQAPATPETSPRDASHATGDRRLELGDELDEALVNEFGNADQYCLDLGGEMDAESDGEDPMVALGREIATIHGIVKLSRNMTEPNAMRRDLEQTRRDLGRARMSAEDRRA